VAYIRRLREETVASYCATKLTIDPSAWIAPGAALVGEVTIGARASVWFQATVRGDLSPITIGEESNVQDQCVLHVERDGPVVLGRRVTLGHGAIVHGAIVEDEVLVAMKAVVLSGCHIGRRSIVGAGAVVPEGTRVPEGSLVLGVPGKVVRPLREDEIARVVRNAASYVDLAAAYRRGEVKVP
jgi:carbonic anhydrase/acetyltransferase-like protein (isoleucine patch superfamily)